MTLEKYTKESKFDPNHEYGIVIYSFYDETEGTEIETGGKHLNAWLDGIQESAKTGYDTHVVGYVDLTKADEEGLFSSEIDLDHQVRKVFKVGSYTWDDDADWSEGEPEKTKLESVSYVSYVNLDSWEYETGDCKVLGELKLDYVPMW